MLKTLNLGIEINQNTDFALVISITNESGAIDITDYGFKSQMRSTTDSTGEAVAEFEFEVLDQTTNTGQVKWFLPAASTAEDVFTTSTATALVNGRLTTPFIFDVKMKDNAGVISRIIQGIIYMSPEATQEGFT